MKKKFIVAALLAGVMAASCFAGCIGNGDGENGEQGQQGSVEKGVAVTADEWASAVNASMNSQNFTMDILYSETKTVAGYYKGNDKIPVNIVDKSNGYEYAYGDPSKNNFYRYNYSSDYFVSGFGDIYSHQADYTEEWLESLKDCLSSCGINHYEDKEESWTEISYGVKIGEKSYKAEKVGESDWSVWNYSMIALSDAFPDYFATEESGEGKSLAELYEAFTYSDGVYTAELMPGESEMLYTVSVSFKDGYILSMSLYCNESKVEEMDGLTVTSVGETTAKIYNIGNTSITPDPDAVKAVEDYIKENS